MTNRRGRKDVGQKDGGRKDIERKDVERKDVTRSRRLKMLYFITVPSGSIQHEIIVLTCPLFLLELKNTFLC